MSLTSAEVKELAKDTGISLQEAQRILVFQELQESINDLRYDIGIKDNEDCLDRLLMVVEDILHFSNPNEAKYNV